MLLISSHVIPSNGRIETIWAVVKNRIGRKGGVKNIGQMSELLLASVKQVERKTWLGAYAKTREWEDKMVDREDTFADVDGPDALEEPEMPSTGTVDDVEEGPGDEQCEDADEGGDAC